ncbi:MAG: hypothetical protein GY906_27640 [bacterium]|nr:hypothetical protein [bacterium]
MVLSKYMPATMLLFSFILMPIGVSAQNLVSNPHFDINLAGWTGSGWWDSDDFSGNPQSGGSATYINQNVGPVSFYIVRQCVELMTAGQTYQLSGYFHLPTGHTGTGWGQLGIAWYSSSGCTPADYISGADAPHIRTIGSWRKTLLTEEAPFEAVSAYVYTINYKSNANGTFQVSADEIVLQEMDAIFGDDFESGGASNWSGTAP